MSELREDLLAPTLTKKRVIAVIIVAVLLVSLLATSTYFISLIFDSQRDDPSKELSDAEYDDLKLVFVKPPFDWDDIDLSDEEMEALAEMFDGNVDNLDLPAYAALIAALLGSEVEVFRIYNYSSINALEDVLWRQECFDVYNGQSWDTSSIIEPYDFYSIDDYNSYYSSQDKVRIQTVLSVNPGPNSLVLRNQFPIPYIIDETLSSPNLDYSQLYKNDLDSASINLYYSNGGDVNMSYETFGQYIRTDSEVNSTSLDENDIDQLITNRFLQLPTNYISGNSFVQTHYNILNAIINDGDNVFTVADKIRNYLETNFIFSVEPTLNDPIQPGEDIVNRFLENGGGVWSDFASAFCVFARAFGVPSRFIDGFNGLNITELLDGVNPYAVVKYKNIYNWAEIFVPTAGGGNWVQMDIYPTNEILFNITLTSNATQNMGRNEYVNFTAELTSASQTVDGRNIVFTDQITGDTKFATTDSNGIANITYEIDQNQVIGPHNIVASYISISSNPISYIVYGPVEVVITSIIPQEVNVSHAIPDKVNIQGYVRDPVYKDYVKFAYVEFILFEKGTSTKVTNALIPSLANTLDNGLFGEDIIVDKNTNPGSYEIRVDFNGSWVGFSTLLVSNSSNRVDFNVTKEINFNFKLSIDGIQTNEDNPWAPMTLNYFKNGDFINLSTNVKDINGSVVSGEEVKFYDFTNGDVMIGSAFTDIEGNASILYNVGISNKSGPTLVYAKIGKDESYSYYVFNESINFDFISGPIPREINSDSTPPNTFGINFRLVDNSGNPINFSRVNLEMWTGVDLSNLLVPSYPEYFSSSNEFFLSGIGVSSLTPVGNYSLLLSFKGVFDYSSNPYYPHYFSEGEVLLYSNYAITNQLKVVDPQDVSIIFKIDGNHALDTFDTYDNNNFWTSYNSGQNITFEVWINQSGDYADANSIVRVMDSYTGLELGSYNFKASDNGYHKFLINTSDPIQMHSGLHLIKIAFENPVGNPLITENSTYVYINESFVISSSSNDYEVLRNNDVFTISGDISNGTEKLRGVNVTLSIFNSSFVDASNDFIFNLYDITASNGFYSFTVLPKLSCPKGTYKFIVSYEGSLRRLNEPTSIIMYDYNFVNVNSSFININVTASSIINEDSYYTKYGLDSDTEWLEGDTLYVIGNLTWDDGSIYSDMFINVTVQNSAGTVLDSNYTIKTSPTGYFNATITVGAGWPSRSTTKIIVYFDPIYNGEDFVIGTETTFT